MNCLNKIIAFCEKHYIVFYTSINENELKIIKIFEFLIVFNQLNEEDFCSVNIFGNLEDTIYYQKVNYQKACSILKNIFGIKETSKHHRPDLENLL